jgi:chemotaxis protein histidine kinase CheA
LGLDSQKSEWFQVVYNQVFEDVFPEETSLGQLPDRFKVGDRTLQFKGRALRDEAGKVRAVLCSVTDITALERAEIENLEHRTLIKILKSPQAFSDFISDVRNSVASMEKMYTTRDQTGIRRIMHTLKGNFGCFDIVAISRLIHNIEEKETISLDDIVAVRQATQSFLQKYFDVLRMDYDGNQPITHSVPDATIVELEAMLSQEARISHQDLLDRIRTLRLKSVKELMGPIDDLVAQASDRLGKSVSFEVIGDDLRIDADVIKPVIEVLPHLLKNAIDHGIEPEYERGSKSAQGALSVRFEPSPTGLRLSIIDDGRGLDAVAIERKARQKGLLKSNETPTPEQIIQFIFLDDFSTAETISEISGRGVGMAAVRAAVQKCKGTIAVKSQTGEGCTFLIEIPVLAKSQMVRPSAVSFKKAA